MSRFLIAAWVGLVTISCTVFGGEPMYMNASYGHRHMSYMDGGGGCGFDCRGGFGCRGGCGRSCARACDPCRGFDLCCPRIIPAIVNKIDCVLQWAFCDPCNAPCARPAPCRRAACCGDYGWNGYMSRCRCQPRCGFEPCCGMGGDNWSPVTPADPFRDDDLKSPPPTPAAERNTRSSDMSIYARPHVSIYRAAREPKLSRSVEELDSVALETVAEDVEEAAALEADEIEESMVRHASAERKISEIRLPTKKPSKVTRQVSSAETKSPFPRNPLREEE